MKTLLAGLVLLVPVAAQDPLPRPVLRCSGANPHSTDGTLQLSWHVGKENEQEGLSFQLEEDEQTAEGEDLLRIDAGPYLAAALSGRDDGRYRYRVRAVKADGAAGPWSNPVEAHVQHHSLVLAFTLFGIGAIVFLATASLVLFGHRKSRRAGN
jgi:hypothetical protein